MFNNRDLDSWVANFSEPVKAILQQAAEAEDWPTDNEPEVQELLNLISSLGTSTHSAVFKAERDEGDVDLYRKVLRDLSPEELVEIMNRTLRPS